jgi:CAAX protease family protein
VVGSVAHYNVDADTSDSNPPFVVRALDDLEWKCIFSEIQIALHAEELEQAHYKLRALIETRAQDPKLWLLLAWTAPSFSLAQVFVRRFQRLKPDFPMSGRELPWSGHSWIATIDHSGIGQNQDGAYKQIRTALQAHELKRAHNLLRSLITDHSQVSELWLLLTWTAPSRHAAHVFFRRMQCLQPSHPIVEGRLPWSGRNWAIAVGAHAEQPKGLIGELGKLSFIASLALYLLGITLAELLTTYFDPRLGLILHGGLLMLILFHAAFVSSAKERKFLLALSMAPLIRLLSLSMPLEGYEFTYWYAIIGVPLMLSAYLVLRLNGYKPADVGLSASRLPLQLLIGLAGFALGWAEYQILKPPPLVQTWHLQDIWIPMLILLVFTGFLEEFIFRGLMQRASQDVLSKYGLYYVSLLFAVLHIGYRSFFDFGFVLLVGLAFALITKHTRSIWGVSLAHGLTNIALYIIVPLL